MVLVKNKLQAHVVFLKLLFLPTVKTYLMLHPWISWASSLSLTTNPSVQSLSHVQLFVTPWTAARQASLSITNSQSMLKFMSIKSVIHPTISSSVVLFSSCLQSCPASGSFLKNQLFASGGQSIAASASVLLMNIQDWFPLGLTCLISFQSKGL